MSEHSIDLTAQPDDIRLQILLAKVRPSPAEQARVAELAPRIRDWAGFARMAKRNFSLPLVRRNLATLKEGMIPPETWDQIQQGATQAAFHNMAMIRAQDQFRKTCLAPLGVGGIFFKGVSIAATYYPDLSLRPCRDIDLLVPKGTLRALINKALSEGYVPVSPDGRVVPLTSARDVDALLRFGDSVTLVTPDGVVIDLQDHLDKHSGIFTGYDLFANASSYQVAGLRFATLSTDFLLNYSCYHHTRHTWSRLHWLSDLDAICSSDQFDRDAALELADRLGQRGTVEASLELHQLMGSDALWDNSDHLQRGKAFLSLSIRNLKGDLALEKKLSLSLKGGEFMYSWQASLDLIRRARRGRWRSIFRPTVSLYARLPLPRALHWVYYVIRFFELSYLLLDRLRPARKQ